MIYIEKNSLLFLVRNKHKKTRYADLFVTLLRTSKQSQ